MEPSMRNPLSVILYLLGLFLFFGLFLTFKKNPLFISSIYDNRTIISTISVAIIGFPLTAFWSRFSAFDNIESLSDATKNKIKLMTKQQRKSILKHFFQILVLMLIVYMILIFCAEAKKNMAWYSIPALFLSLFFMKLYYFILWFFSAYFAFEANREIIIEGQYKIIERQKLIAEMRKAKEQSNGVGRTK